MISTDFEYARPVSVRDALHLLGTAGARPLAGGQSLVPNLADGSTTASMLVDISRLPDLRRVALTADHLSIGAAATLDAVMVAEAAAGVPLLLQVLRSVASIAIRSRGTLIGNLVSASPNSELPVAVVALGGSLVLQSLSGERVVAAGDFFLGPRQTALQAGELVTELRVPRSPGPMHGGFAEVALRSGAPPLCCVAVCVWSDADHRVRDARIVVGGITGVPSRCAAHEAAIVGHPTSEVATRLKSASATLVPSPALPDAAYALDVLPVLIKRAAAQALSSLDLSASTGGPSA